MKLNKTNFFEWKASEKDGPMELDESCITFKPEKEGEDTPSWKSIRKGRILASNPLPRSIGTASFLVTSPSLNPKFDVGFTTSKKSVVYEGGSGTISKENMVENWDYDNERFWKQYIDPKKREKITDVETCEANDIIKCTVIYKKRIAAVHFMKNGILMSKQALQTRGTVWPVIVIGSAQTQIKINPTPVEEGSQDKPGIMVIKYQDPTKFNIKQAIMVRSIKIFAVLF